MTFSPDTLVVLSWLPEEPHGFSIRKLTKLVYRDSTAYILRKHIRQALKEIKAAGALHHIYRSDWPAQEKHRYGILHKRWDWAMDLMKQEDIPEHLETSRSSQN